MGLMDRMIGKVADQVASRLEGRGTLNVERATPAAAAASFTPPDGFGPGVPLTPREPAGTLPREWQYPVGANLSVTPRSSEPYGFDTLRNLADYCDLVRIAIEMRKNDIARLDWSVVPKEKADAKKFQDEIRAVSTFLEEPDQETPWDGWLRMLMEDLLVLDAASLYRRRARNGTLFALEVIDGSSIKVLLDGRGRTPAPPLPAYQQVLYGFPSTDLTSEELLYRPKNRRARSAYGSSPVEWIILAINWYLRREQFNLGYYTFGNVPEGIASAPEGWTPEQIRQFESWFNTVVTGNVEELRKIRFVGHGFSFERFRDMNFEVAHEEWLARVITAAFGVSYQRFVQRVVRATAEVAASETADMGLEPDKRFLAGVMTKILAADFKMPFLQFQFVGGETKNDAADEAKRKDYVAAGILSRDQVAVLEGGEPWNLPLTRVPTVTTPSGLISLDPSVPSTAGAGAGGPGSKGAEALGRTGAAAASDPSDQTSLTRPTDPTGQTDSEKADLVKWRRKAIKAFREGKIERAVAFSSTAIAPDVHAAITRRLAAARTEADVVKAFSEGTTGRTDRTPDRTKQQDPEVLSRIQAIMARRFQQQGVRLAAAAHTIHHTEGGA